MQASILPLEAIPRALVNRDTTGLFKLIAEAGTGRLLGASIIAGLTVAPAAFPPATNLRAAVAHAVYGLSGGCCSPPAPKTRSAAPYPFDSQRLEGDTDE